MNMQITFLEHYKLVLLDIPVYFHQNVNKLAILKQIQDVLIDVMLKHKIFVQNNIRQQLV